MTESRLQLPCYDLFLSVWYLFEVQGESMARPVIKIDVWSVRFTIDTLARLNATGGLKQGLRALVQPTPRPPAHPRPSRPPRTGRTLANSKPLARPLACPFAGPRVPLVLRREAAPGQSAGGVCRQGERAPPSSFPPASLAPQLGLEGRAAFCRLTRCCPALAGGL